MNPTVFLFLFMIALASMLSVILGNPIFFVAPLLLVLFLVSDAMKDNTSSKADVCRSASETVCRSESETEIDSEIVIV